LIFLLTGSSEMSSVQREEIIKLVSLHGGSWITDEQFNRRGADCLHQHMNVLTSNDDNDDEDCIPCLMLLASCAVRTSKFLVALATHVPCLHYNWLLRSVEQQRLVAFREYLLPAAVVGRTVFPSPLTAPLRLQPFAVRRALAGVRVEIEGDNVFRRNWECVLRAAGARHAVG
jgi:hypothetical protein